MSSCFLCLHEGWVDCIDPIKSITLYLDYCNVCCIFKPLNDCNLQYTSRFFDGGWKFVFGIDTVKVLDYWIYMFTEALIALAQTSCQLHQAHDIVVYRRRSFHTWRGRPGGIPPEEGQRSRSKVK